MCDKVKEIFQIYHEDSIEKCPNIVRAGMESWIEKNPDYKHTYISYKDGYVYTLDKVGKKIFNDVFLKLSTRAAKCDFMRCIFLYDFGGVYVDSDNFCVQPIDVLCENNDVVLVKHNDHFLQSGFIYSIKKNDLWMEIIEDGITLFQTIERRTPHFIMGTFGPYALTRNALKYYACSSLEQLSHKIHILDDHESRFFIDTKYGSSEFTGVVPGYESWIGEDMKDFDLNSEQIFYRYWRNT